MASTAECARKNKNENKRKSMQEATKTFFNYIFHLRVLYCNQKHQSKRYEAI